MNKSTENRIPFLDPLRNSGAFQAINKITVLLMSSTPLLSFWTHTIYKTWFHQLLCHSTTLTIETLCPISTLNQHFTYLEKTHVRCSFHCERWTVKGEMARQLCFLSKKLLTGRKNQRNSCQGWRVEWSLEARRNGFISAVFDEPLFLIVAICFSCFLCVVCCCNICCFVEILFVPLLRWFEVKSKTSSMISL